MYEQFDNNINELLGKMTLREKIGQLNMLPTRDPEALKEAIRKGDVGSLIFTNSATAGNVDEEQLQTDFYNELQRIAVEESPNHIPLIYSKDVIHGYRTEYPIPLACAAAFNDELLEKCYRNIAKEASNDGIHWTFAPMLDMCRDPRWGRIVEGPAEDPFVGECMARATVKGIQGKDISAKDSMVACAKHYIGYGASESGRDYARTEISDYSLYNYYLPAFRAAIDAGVGTIMSSFNDINGQPVSSSKKYLTDILRDQLHFEGCVVSDWGSVSMPLRHGTAETPANSAKLSIEAGIDIDMCCNCYLDNLEELVNTGMVSVETVNNAARNVLKIKMAKGLFENPYIQHEKLDRTPFLADAREMATESMVLLKNDGVLPLKKNQHIVLAGPMVRERRALLGTWAAVGRTEETPNLLEAMTDAMDDGFLHYDPTETYIYYDLCQLSRQSDTIVLALGESNRASGENRCVADISLDTAQIELIHQAKALGKKVVGIFFCGRPIAMENIINQLDAVLYAWHSGSETANAVCDILFGDVVPSGKTPVTFPRKTGHIPVYYNITSSGNGANCYYGELIEYAYVDGISTPMFPFGFGLSYTEFEYEKPISDTDNLSLDEICNGKFFKISVNVKNIGEYDGKETVQLYIRDKVASMMRPMRELKGYKKVMIHKGETANLEFELGYDKLGFYTDTGKYIVEKGEFEIYVGENCLTDNKISIWIK